MITQTQMYWLTRLDHVESLVIFLALAIGFTVIGSLFVAMMRYNRPEDAFPLFRRVILYAVLPLSLAVLAIKTLVPSVKEVAAIIVIPKIVNNEKVQTIGNRLYDLAVEWMDELRPAKPEKKGE